MEAITESLKNGIHIGRHSHVLFRDNALRPFHIWFGLRKGGSTSESPHEPIHSSCRHSLAHFNQGIPQHCEEKTRSKKYVLEQTVLQFNNPLNKRIPPSLHLRIETEGVQTQRRRVIDVKNPHTARPKRDGGRWGVAQACDCRTILDAIATLIEAHRPDLAIGLIIQELNSQT